MKAIVLGGILYQQLVKDCGYELTIELDDDVDLVMFTGGADVHPSLYNEDEGPYTMSDPARDAYEQKVFLQYKHVPKVGICRGAQFLTVMNGSRLIQHIEGHAKAGTHEMHTSSKEHFRVTSTHHQMMRLNDNCELLAWANQDTDPIEVIQPEVVWYPDTKSLAVQYHPEYMDKDSRGYTYFLELMEKYCV